MKFKFYISIVSVLITFSFSSCYKAIPKSKDVELGKLTVNQIYADPATYPIVSKKDNPESYKQLTRIVNNILSSPKIKQKSIFAYDSITIINDDDVINAFCTPGGYIFVYTGLIKMAKSEDQIAAIIGHEIAHAELRHSVKKLSRSVGRQAIIIAGAAAAGASFGVFIAVEVGNKILGLGMGREQENKADKYAVIYLGTGNNYSSVALADFFEILAASGKDAKIPPILSTHPDTQSRIERIKKWAKKYDYNTDYQEHPEFSILQKSINQIQ